MAVTTSSSSLPLQNKRPTFSNKVPKEIQDAILRLYDLAYTHASSIETLRQEMNKKVNI